MECDFDLALVASDLPPFPVPAEHTEASYLRELTWQGAARRFGDRAQNPKAYAQLDHELDVIETLELMSSARVERRGCSTPL